jgi:hypothetical protein
MMQREFIKRNTITTISKHYGIDRRTLLKMIRLKEKELFSDIRLLMDSKCFILPPILVDRIYNSLGMPDNK